jgi:hypothetical protein
MPPCLDIATHILLCSQAVEVPASGLEHVQGGPDDHGGSPAGTMVWFHIVSVTYVAGILTGGGGRLYATQA